MSDNPCLIRDYAMVLLALSAQLWAVGIFWWMHWRKGKIVAGVPRSYAAIASQKDDFLLVRLPLVFHNTGSPAIVVQNLRLTLEQSGRKSPLLHFNQTVSKLDVGQEGDWATQFPVGGREALPLICEFLRKHREGFVFSAGDCDAVLEGKFDQDRTWKVVISFKLHTPEQYLETLNSSRPPIAYDNDPDRQS